MFLFLDEERYDCFDEEINSSRRHRGGWGGGRGTHGRAPAGRGSHGHRRRRPHRKGQHSSEEAVEEVEDSDRGVGRAGIKRML